MTNYFEFSSIEIMLHALLVLVLIAGIGGAGALPDGFSFVEKAQNSVRLGAETKVGILPEMLRQLTAEEPKMARDNALPRLFSALRSRFSKTVGVLAAPLPNPYGLIEPVPEFVQRITKKPFGIFITPKTSPVQPDKFTGYHTGIDVEYEDVSKDVPVRAISDGTVVTHRDVPGYGGVVVVRHEINGEQFFALYGHIDPASFQHDPSSAVKRGEMLGVLGDGYTKETDGARKHLHFSLQRAGEKPDLRGYVKTADDLERWLNPLVFYP